MSWFSLSDCLDLNATTVNGCWGEPTSIGNILMIKLPKLPNGQPLLTPSLAVHDTIETLIYSMAHFKYSYFCLWSVILVCTIFIFLFGFMHWYIYIYISKLEESFKVANKEQSQAWAGLEPIKDQIYSRC